MGLAQAGFPSWTQPVFVQMPPELKPNTVSAGRAWSHTTIFSLPVFLCPSSEIPWNEESPSFTSSALYTFQKMYANYFSPGPNVGSNLENITGIDWSMLSKVHLDLNLYF